MSTTERDRVEAALREYYLDGWGEDGQNAAAWRANCRGAMSRALSAADALAPPPVLDREAVARAVRKVQSSWSVSDDGREASRPFDEAVADAVLALLPAAPPPVPEDVRWDWRDAWCEYRDAHVGQPAPTPMNAFVAGWEALRQLPAPPADTGDRGAAGDIAALARKAESLAGQVDFAGAKGDDPMLPLMRLREAQTSLVVALTRRVRELEEALLGTAADLEARAYHVRNLAYALDRRLTADHLTALAGRARAIIGGSSHAD